MSPGKRTGDLGEEPAAIGAAIVVFLLKFTTSTHWQSISRVLETLRALPRRISFLHGSAQNSIRTRCTHRPTSM
jgi:hypothetical protein